MVCYHIMCSAIENIKDKKTGKDIIYYHYIFMTSYNKIR